MVEERLLFCPSEERPDDPPRLERGPELSDRLLREDLPEDRLPMAAGFLEMLLLDLCALLRLAVCAMIMIFDLVLSNDCGSCGCHNQSVRCGW
jgi:hypothetical protein